MKSVAVVYGPFVVSAIQYVDSTSRKTRAAAAITVLCRDVTSRADRLAWRHHWRHRPSDDVMSQQRRRVVMWSECVEQLTQLDAVGRGVRSSRSQSVVQLVVTSWRRIDAQLRPGGVAVWKPRTVEHCRPSEVEPLQHRLTLRLYRRQTDSTTTYDFFPFFACGPQSMFPKNPKNLQTELGNFEIFRDIYVESMAWIGQGTKTMSGLTQQKSTLVANLWLPLLPYGYSYKASGARPG